MTNKDNSKISTNTSSDKDSETPFQRFIKEIDSKLRKEEKHTWMIKDTTHQNQNE